MNKIDFSRNYLNLEYSENNHFFILKDEDFKKVFMRNMDTLLFKNSSTIIKCNENTFSARDGASIKFTQSEFYENMLDSLGYSRNENIIRNIRGLKKIDINYDMYCGGDKLLLRKIKNDPSEFINSQTPVCYIFKSTYRDEQYQYDLYIKLFTKGNQINVMSLHWYDAENKVLPKEVYNYRTREFDDINKVNRFLEEKINNYSYER